MLARIAGMDATNNKESVTGVVIMDGAVEKIGKEMVVMEQLVNKIIIHVF